MPERLTTCLRQFVLVTLLILWIVAIGGSLFCTLRLICPPESADWWALVIAVVGVPILIYELYRLRLVIIESQRRPILDIGVIALPDTIGTAPGDLDISRSATLDVSHVQINDSRIDAIFDPQNIQDLKNLFALIVRNKGNRPARFVKIELKITAFPTIRPPFLFFDGYELEEHETVWIFRGSGNWVLYPQDTAAIPFSTWDPNLLEKYRDTFASSTLFWNETYEDLTGEIPSPTSSYKSVSESAFTFLLCFKPGEYVFQCTAWTDGHTDPTLQKLTLTIVESKLHQRSIERLKHDIYIRM